MERSWRPNWQNYLNNANMKKLFVSGLSMIQLIALGQTGNKFIINGRYGVYNSPVKAYLEYTMNGKPVVDSDT